MTILMIEDERPAGERLKAMVAEFDPDIRIAALLRSVRESLAWLASHPAPDLILADIQLGDGLSLEIFKQHPVTSPIIFTTAYDEYLMSALATNSIDYLLKPIDKMKLFHALRKYRSLQQHFTGNIAALMAHVQSRAPIKHRMVVKKGTEYLVLRTDQAAYFFSEHKVTFLTDTEGVRYLLDKSLSDIEQELDTKQFFRLNRKYLVQISAIVKFKSHEKGKILVELRPPVAEEVIVSQENAPHFRAWIGK